MTSLATAITIREEDYFELVSAWTCVERRAVHFNAFRFLSFLESCPEIVHFPEELAVTERLTVPDNFSQLLDFLLLLDGDLGDESQVFFYILL